MRVFMLAACVAVLLSLSAVWPSDAAILTVEQPQSIAGGQVVTVSHMRDTDRYSSTVQFDIHYPPDQVQPTGVTVGSAAEAARKGASYNVVEPGVLRVIIGGINQTPIEDGDIAQVTFEPVETATGGTVNYTLRNTVVADGAGRSIISHGVDSEQTEIEPGDTSSGADANLFEPISTSETSGGPSAEGAGRLPGRVSIPGLIDTDVTDSPVSVSPDTSRPAPVATVTSPEVAERSGMQRRDTYTTIAQAPDEPETRAARSAAEPAETALPEPFHAPAPTIRDGQELPETDAETGQVDEEERANTDRSASGRRWKILAVEALVVIVAIMLFLGARKAFKV